MRQPLVAHAVVKPLKPSACNVAHGRWLRDNVHDNVVEKNLNVLAFVVSSEFSFASQRSTVGFVFVQRVYLAPLLFQWASRTGFAVRITPTPLHPLAYLRFKSCLQHHPLMLAPSTSLPLGLFPIATTPLAFVRFICCISFLSLSLSLLWAVLTSVRSP